MRRSAGDRGGSRLLFGLVTIGLIVRAFHAPARAAGDACAVNADRRPAVVAASPLPLGLSSGLTLTVSNGQSVLDCAHSARKPIALIVDGRQLSDVLADGDVSAAGDGTIKLHFFVPHDESAVDVWARMSREKRGEAWIVLDSHTTASVGILDVDTFAVDPLTVPVRLATLWWFIVSMLALATVLVSFFWLAVNTDLLREGPQPSKGRRPFSLAKTQMGAWFVTILASWLVLYVFIHTFNTITNGLLILLGICATTALAGGVIDNNAAQAKIARQLTAPYPSNAASSVAQGVATSQGFLSDILADDSAVGVSFHRFQLVAWTSVLILVFLRQVLFFLTMPDFDATLLSLMGISSGTYVGLKSVAAQAQP
jgi:hypothetical protein